MQVSAANQAPWGTVVLAAGNVAVFVFVGGAPDYALSGVGGEPEVPSIGRLVFDVLRHPGPLLLFTTLLVLVPISVTVERIVGAVGLGATYLVAGFATGFVEVITRSGEAPVAGAFGGTTALLVMWSVTRWRERRDLLVTIAVTTAVIAGWFWTMHVLRSDGVPAIGAAAAGWLGLVGIGAIRFRRQPKA